MFDFVRKHIKVMQFVLFLLIVPSFVLFGIDGYTRFSDKGAVVATVAGQEITQTQWDEAHKQEAERMRQSMPNQDARFFDSPQAKFASLERLVRDAVLAAAAKDLYLTVSDERLAQELQQNPTISSLRKPDGSLDFQRYSQLVGAQGMSPQMFENRMRQDLAAQQIMQGVVGTGPQLAALSDPALNAFFDRRAVQIAKFSLADYAAKVNLTEEQMQQHYKDNVSLFQATEQADVEYVVLDVEGLKKSITLDPEEVKTYYQQNLASASGKQERRASHILINVSKSASAAERDAAKAKANALLQQVKKSPSSFAEVAKSSSQDPGSAANGGDLDFFAKGAMVKSFEDAVYALVNKGDISDLVESEFGYHIIMLTDIKAPKVKTLDESRLEIEDELRKQQAQKRFAEVADTFSNTVYEQSDSLKPIADKLKLEIRTVQGLQRKALKGGKGPLANQKFIDALFGLDSVDKKRNTEAIEFGSNQMVAGRVTQYTPARTLPYEQVKAVVKQNATAALSFELAKKDGAAALSDWKQNPAQSKLDAPITISRDSANSLPKDLIEAVLTADTSKLPAWVGVEVSGQGYIVAKVNNVVPRAEVTPAQQQQERSQLASLMAQAEAMAYYESLKSIYKAKILVKKPDPNAPILATESSSTSAASSAEVAASKP